jgi:hypothetical protein
MPLPSQLRQQMEANEAKLRGDARRLQADLEDAQARLAAAEASRVRKSEALKEMKGLLATSASQVEAGKQQIQQLRWVRAYWSLSRTAQGTRSRLTLCAGGTGISNAPVPHAQMYPCTCTRCVTASVSCVCSFCGL